MRKRAAWLRSKNAGAHPCAYVISTLEITTTSTLARKVYTMSIAAIESVLQQMRATALQTGFAPSRADDAAESVQAGGFAGELKRTLNRINGMQQQAYGQAEAFELGKPGVALNDVMVDLQKANVAFQTGLQVRNRLVAAYQEVMNLPA